MQISLTKIIHTLQLSKISFEEFVLLFESTTNRKLKSQKELVLNFRLEGDRAIVKRMEGKEIPYFETIVLVNVGFMESEDMKILTKWTIKGQKCEASEKTESNHLGKEINAKLYLSSIISAANKSKQNFTIWKTSMTMKEFGRIIKAAKSCRKVCILYCSIKGKDAFLASLKFSKIKEILLEGNKEDCDLIRELANSKAIWENLELIVGSSEVGMLINEIGNTKCKFELK